MGCGVVIIRMDSLSSAEATEQRSLHPWRIHVMNVNIAVANGNCIKRNTWSHLESLEVASSDSK